MTSLRKTNPMCAVRRIKTTLALIIVVSSLNAGQQADIKPFDTTVYVNRGATGIPIERYGVSLYWGTGPVPAICP